MKTLMYPIAPDDDFPEMFCAIRQGSGEHWFYVPEGESASWMLFRAESENAKLRELVRDMMRYYFMPSAIDSKQRETELLERAHELGVEKDNGELGVEVDG